MVNIPNEKKFISLERETSVYGEIDAKNILEYSEKQFHF